MAVRLGPFVVESLLGRGGMADVYRGVHVAQQTPVAIKVITATYAQEPLFLQSFNNEIRAVARLHHPGIVMVFDHGSVPEHLEVDDQHIDASSPFLVMEYATYGALDRVTGVLRWRALRALLLSLLDALAHAHARGVLHRDLKPGNILVSSNDDLRPGVKLTDFGIAHAMEREGVPHASEITGGTPLFMAPEQFDASWRDYGPWTDLYALGCLTFLYATGRPPFVADHPMSLAVSHLRKSVPRFIPKHAMPRELEAWVLRLLEKDPRDRFRVAADAAWALRQMRAPRVASEPSHEPSVVKLLSSLDTDDTSESSAASRPASWSSEDLSARTFTLIWDENSLDRETEEMADTATDLEAQVTAEEDSDSLLTFLGDDETDDDLSPSIEPSRPPPVVPVLPPLPSSWRRPAATTPPIHLMGVGLGLYGLRSIPLVDRERERDALWRALETVRSQRSARAVVLTGPAGTGKSRLVEWIGERAAEVGSATVLRAMHSPNAGPSDGLPRMIARHLRVTDLPRDGVVERAEDVLRSLGEHDPFEWHAIADLIAPGPLDVKQTSRLVLPEGRERHAIILRYVERLTEERPVVVWLDDVHWSTDALQFAERVLEEQERRPRPILLLLTAREEHLAERTLESRLLKALMSSPRTEPLAVAPLKADDHMRLVRELLGLNRHVAHLVAQRTAGNPLFAVQLVGDWVQRGVLTLGEAGFSLASGESSELPDGIHAVWAQRVELLLDELPPEAKTALEVAAILGREVDQIEWEAVCHKAGVEPPAALLDLLVSRRLVQPTELGFAFVHSMLGEAIERLAKESGVFEQHHRRCAEMLYERYGSLTRGMAERIGRHYLAGLSYKEALSPLLRGANERFRSSEYLEAEALLRDYEKALTSLGARKADARWCDCWVLRARLATMQGNYDESIEWGFKAEENARRWDLSRVIGEATRERALVAFHRGQPENSLELFQRAQATFEKQNDEVGIAQCHLGMGDVRFRLGNLAGAADRYLDALAIVGPSANTIESAAALWGLGYVALWRGEHDRARRLFKRQQRIAERSQNRYGIAQCISGLADVARMEKDYDRAERDYRRAIEIFDAIGSKDGQIGRLNRALVLMARGDTLEGRRIIDAVKPSMEAAFGRIHLSQIYALTLPGVADAGSWKAWDENFTILERLLGESRYIDGDIAWALDLAAQRVVEKGEIDRALEAYRISTPMWRTLGRKAETSSNERVIEALTAKSKNS